MATYEMVIGLEVHVELATKTKIFCGCTTKFGGAPNTHTCPVCTGMPGTLPVANKKVVEFAVAAGWRRTARSRDTTTSSTARTILTPTFPRRIRSASSICRSAETAMSISRRRRAKRPSASTKSTWRRTQASWCTTRGWMKRWWITTGAACRCWKSSPNRTCARRRK